MAKMNPGDLATFANPAGRDEEDMAPGAGVADEALQGAITDEPLEPDLEEAVQLLAPHLEALQNAAFEFAEAAAKTEEPDDMAMFVLDFLDTLDDEALAGIDALGVISEEQAAALAQALTGDVLDTSQDDTMALGVFLFNVAEVANNEEGLETPADEAAETPEEQEEEDELGLEQELGEEE